MIDAIIELAEHAAKEPCDFEAEDISHLIDATTKVVGEDLKAAYKLTDKMQRHAALSAAKTKAAELLVKSDANPDGHDSAKFGAVFKECEAVVLRRDVLKTGKRIDGRDVDDGPPDRRGGGRACRARTARRCSPAARPRRWWSPRWAPATTSSSSTRSRAPTRKPSCCTTTSRPTRVGETGRMNAPGRREIGHGKLAWRAIRADAAERGRVPLHHPPGLGDHRVQRLVVDGDGLRLIAGADGRRACR